MKMYIQVLLDIEVDDYRHRMADTLYFVFTKKQKLSEKTTLF